MASARNAGANRTFSIPESGNLVFGLTQPPSLKSRFSSLCSQATEGNPCFVSLAELHTNHHSVLCPSETALKYTKADRQQPYLHANRITFSPAGNAQQNQYKVGQSPQPLKNHSEGSAYLRPPTNLRTTDSDKTLHTLAELSQGTLIHAFDNSLNGSSEGVFQFVSPRAHRISQASIGAARNAEIGKNGPSKETPLAQQIDDALKSNGNKPLKLSNGTEISRVEKQAPLPSDNPCDHASYIVTIVDRRGDTPTTCQIRITQVAPPFDGKALKADYLDASNQLYEAHLNATGNAHANGQVLSYAGIGRSASMVVYNQIKQLVGQCAVDANNLNDMVDALIRQGKQQRGPKFIHTQQQYEQLIIACEQLLLSLSTPAHAGPQTRDAGFTLDQVVATKKVQINIPAQLDSQEYEIKSVSRGETIPIDQANHVVTGDLHGSPLKLFEHLVAAKLISASDATAEKIASRLTELGSLTKPISDKLPTWGRLAPIHQNMAITELYRKPEAEDREVFQNVANICDELQTAFQEIQWVDENRTLTLIGDVVADRGPSDAVTLALINHLRKGNPSRVDVIASNHDHFILEMLVKDPTQLALTEDGYQGSIMPSQSFSAHIAHLVAQSQGRDSAQGRDSVEALRKNYANHLASSKLIDFNVKTGTMCVHAPINFKHLQKLVTEFQDKYSDTMKAELTKTMSPKEFATLCNQLNQCYTRYVGDVIENRQLDENIEKALVDGEDTALSWGQPNGFLWTREYIDEEQNALDFENLGVTNLVYGHTARELDLDEQQSKEGGLAYFGLDQDVRKSASNTDQSDKTSPVFCENRT